MRRALRSLLASKLAAALVLAAALALVAAHDARADAPSDVVVKMSCEKIGQPGRVRCEVEARASAGAAIRWGDVEIVSVPSFVTPLRGRIGPREATTREDDAWRWPFALAARERGNGDVQARVRVVVCVGMKCSPRQLGVTARVHVGE